MKYYYIVRKDIYEYTYYNGLGEIVSYEDYQNWPDEASDIEKDFETRDRSYVVRKFAKMKDAKAFLATMEDVCEPYYSVQHHLEKVELY